MSQAAKRPATDAFDGEGDATRAGTSNKRRRTRKKAVNGNHDDVTATTPTTKDKQDISSPVRSKNDPTVTRVDVTPVVVKQHPVTETTSETTPQEQADGKELIVFDKNRGHTKSRAGKKSKKAKSTRSGVSVGPNAWNISTASGGVFVEHDPVFTADGRHMIVPTRDRVNIYSLATSLLVRSIHIKLVISSCYLSLLDPRRIIVATRNGLIVEHDWTTGSKISKWQTMQGLIAVAGAEESDTSRHMFTIKSADDKNDELFLLSTQSAQKEAKAKLLIRDPKLHKSIIVSPDASQVVVCGINAVHVGTSDRSPAKAVGLEASYTWHKLPVTGSVSSFDVRFDSPHNRPSKKGASVDVVVGYENGPIHIYEDVVSKLIQKTKSGQPLDPIGRRLHWHRGPVRSVKWSRDGNYLISGGEESVLVLWQLETNQQQYLPHLSTAILNITVSASGSKYALRLADNSVMVISTADLAPSTNIIGLSLPSHRQDTAPVLIHPAHPNRLIAAISTRSIGGSKLSSNAITHLQTFDIESNLQLGRQALTRNLTTAVNVAPNGQLLQEPSITHMGISFDGQWLATVERWTPSDSDIEAMFLHGDDQLAKQQLTETLLRFWSWNAEETSWDLTNRIDEPHVASKFSVLALASNPVTSEFSTMGQDGTVRIWRPRRRTRDGLQVKTKSGSALFNWSCAQTARIEKSQIDAESALQASGTLTYSEDGSIIAASLSAKQRYVHLLDPRSGAICTSQPNLLAEGQASLAISGRFLLCLSNGLKVFDMITLQSTFTMNLAVHHSSFLAVNARSKSAAIGINPEERRGSSIVITVNLETPHRDSNTTIEFPGQLRAIVSEPFGKGFVIIDNDCGIRKMTPPGDSGATTSTALVHSAKTVEKDTQMKNFDDLFGRDHNQTQGDQGDQQQRQKLIENASSSGSLSDLLSTGANPISGQLGINELFERVSRAVSGPRTQVLVGA